MGFQIVPELPLRFWRQGDESGVFSVTPYRLAVSHFRPYPSWEGFREIALKGSEAYQGVLNPTRVSRIGLRYINDVSVGQLPVRLEEFFNFYPFVGPTIRHDLSRFHCLVQIQFEDGRDSLVLQMGSKPPSEEQDAEVVLDLDYFLAPQNHLELDETLGGWRQRTQIYRAFSRDVLLNLPEDYSSREVTMPTYAQIRHRRHGVSPRGYAVSPRDLMMGRNATGSNYALGEVGISTLYEHPYLTGVVNPGSQEMLDEAGLVYELAIEIPV